MARAAMPACSWWRDWRGSRWTSTSGFTLNFTAKNSTDSMLDTSAFSSPNSALIGARGRLASVSRVSLGGLMVVDGRGGAEQ